jgi:membrane-associated phospholipid phosphatase
MTNSKPGLILLLLLVFTANIVETAWEASLHVGSPVTPDDNKGAYAVQQFEPAFIDFEFHDTVAAWAVYAYSTSYFVLFPVLALGVLIALARRPEMAPLRVLILAVAIDYLISLPFFLLFPVPERWAHPESSAILLSDQWSAWLIESIRPMSALNNSFPSTHVSLTVIMIVVCWLFQVRLRNTVTALATTVILATFVLGIHWLADMIAGAIVGTMSVMIARRYTDISERRELELVADYRLAPRRLKQLRAAREATSLAFLRPGKVG